RGPSAFAATLSGARLLGEAERVLIVRDPGEAARGGLAPLTLAAGLPAVWDGRFEFTARTPGLAVRKLGGLAARLPAAQQRALAALPAALRPGLPAIVDAAGGVSSPPLGASPAQALSLTWDRLLAAAGLVAREPA